MQHCELLTVGLPGLLTEERGGYSVRSRLFRGAAAQSAAGIGSSMTWLLSLGYASACWLPLDKSSLCVTCPVCRLERLAEPGASLSR